MKTKTKITLKFITSIFIVSLVFFNFSYAKAAYSAGSLVSMTNSARAQNGLGALATNDRLTSAAAAKANDMLNGDYFAHTSPSGQTPWDFINGSGYTYAYAGENLAIGYNDASELFTAWMNSPTHRENILNPNFREIGMAVVSGEFQGSETIVAVQEFGTAQVSNTSTEQVAADNSTPEPENSSNPNPSPIAVANQNKQFTYIKEKTEVTPKTIFAGEEVTFTATLTGDIQTLEAHLFDKKYSLLESGTATGAGSEKTYTLTQKIDTIGTGKAEFVALDKFGNRKSFELGEVTVKETIISKGNTQENQGLIAGFENSLRNNWVIYLAGFSALILGILTYFVWKKTGFQKEKLVSSFRF